MLSRPEGSGERMPRQARPSSRHGLSFVRFVLVALTIVGTALVTRAGGSTEHRTPAVSPHHVAPVPVASPAAIGRRRPPRLVGAEAPVAKLAMYLVDNLATKSYPRDSEYFHGAWQSSDHRCWMCNTGAGAAAAVLSEIPGPRSRFYRGVAIDTFTQAIIAHQLSDGSYNNAAQPQQGYGIPTIFFGVELGEAYIVLNPVLPPRTRSLWQSALRRAAQFLIGLGLVNHYVNGNINLQVTELLYDAWAATGSPTFQADYQASLQFTLAPGPSWPGFGLVITKQAHRADGSDGSGYLGESAVGRSAAAGGNPGFDADYAQYQADEATRLYILSGAPQARRLMNLLTNQLLHRVTAAYLLDSSGGSRHPASDRFVPFTDAAFPVLSWLGIRRDLTRRVPGQFGEVRRELCQNLEYPYMNIYREFGNELSVMLLATLRRGAAASGTGLTSRVTCPDLPPALRHGLVR